MEKVRDRKRESVKRQTGFETDQIRKDRESLNSDAFFENGKTQVGEMLFQDNEGEDVDDDDDADDVVQRLFFVETLVKYEPRCRLIG